MSRQAIFNQIREVAHPIQGNNLQFDPRNLPANSRYLRSAYPQWDTLVRDYPIAHVGVEDFAVVVPVDLQYDGASAIVLSPRNLEGSAIEIAKQPAFGSKGPQRLSIRYTVSPGSTIRFRVRAYGKPIAVPGQPPAPSPEIEILHVTDIESVERLRSLMHSKQHIAVLFEGAEALKLLGTGLFKPGEWKISKNAAGVPQVEINPTWEWVAIALILAVAGISIVTVLCLFAAISLALLLGYRVEVKELKIGEMQIGDQTIAVTLPTLAMTFDPV